MYVKFASFVLYPEVLTWFGYIECKLFEIQVYTRKADEGV